jgi:hypothetical protein
MHLPEPHELVTQPARVGEGVWAGEKTKAIVAKRARPDLRKQLTDAVALVNRGSVDTAPASVGQRALLGWAWGPPILSNWHWQVHHA